MPEGMTEHDDEIAAPMTLALLGWSEFYEDQLLDEDAGLVPMRITNVHRAKVTALSVEGPEKLELPYKHRTTDYAVGDWMLTDLDKGQVVRLLERRSLLRRRTEGSHLSQLISSNIDTLFVVTSCNEDFSAARLERYLALANEADITPVIVLTKADKVDDAGRFISEAQALQRDLQVVSLNGLSPEAVETLQPWCGIGQTVALVGSSGVGKSTLLNTLAAKEGEDRQLTGEIREDDAKGRHTTTSRSLHRIKGGGWVIDTPGMRSLHMGDAASGLGQLFAEIIELAEQCRFRDCTHAHEPGCAVAAAVKSGVLDAERLERWRKLDEENRENTVVLTGPRGNKTAPKTPKGRRR